MDAIERRMAEMERQQALYHRHFQGVQLSGSTSLGPMVRVSADQLLGLWSPNGTVDITQVPATTPHFIGLDVDTGAMCFPLCSDSRTGGITVSFNPFNWAKLCVNISGEETCVAIPFWVCGDGEGCG